MARDVSELGDSHQRYETVVEAMAEGVVLQDASFAILACNEAAERILGLTRDQMTGRTSLDPRWRSIHEDGSPFPGETHPVPVTLATGKPQRDVIMGVHKPDGTLSWISINSLPLLRPGESKPFAAVCTFSDITGRIVAERALAESEARHRRIVETSMDGIWIVDIESRTCVFANQRMADLLGVTIAEVCERPLHEWLDPEDLERLGRKTIEREQGSSETYDLCFRRRDGSLVYCSVAASPLEEAGGRRLSLGMIRDLTASRRAAEELARSQARIQQAFEIAKIGWFEDDFTAGQGEASPELRAICGWGPDEPINHQAWGELIHPDDRAQQRELFERSVASKDAGSMTAEFRIVRRDGATRWVNATARVETSPTTGRPRLVGVLMDVTDRKLLEEGLLESRKLESIGRLAGGVAHDFNNLLTAIFASLGVLKRRLPSAARDDLSAIGTAADRAAGLTRQLLAFARKQVIEVQVIHLNQVVGELENMLRRLAGEHIDLVCKLSVDPWPVRGDLVQVEQVLVNLVANARDAMPDGGTLTISTRNVTLREPDVATGADVAPGDYSVLAVGDTGSGIDEHTLKHIFEPFFTTKRTGTGLGLASAYGAIRQMRGYILAASKPGQGACFEVYLPHWSGGEEPAPPPVPRPPAGPIHETILLVEDDDLLRDVVARGLEGLGYAMLATRDGEQALEIARKHAGPIHLLISDVVMPKLSGRQLVERAQKTRPEMRILFVSGYAENVVVHQGLVEPGFELLSKPFTIDALADRIRKVLDRAA